jgi:heat shock protein HslJ
VRHAALLVGLGIVLASCAPQKTAGPLENTSWRLVTLVNQGLGLPPKDAPTMSIKNAVASGFGGCNGYSMVLTVYGTVVTFGAVTRAERPCSMAATKLENEFFRALIGAARAQIDGDTLILREQTGKERARFKRIKPA